MPRGTATATAIANAASVRLTVIRKSLTSVPPTKPSRVALRASPGDGSSTGSINPRRWMAHHRATNPMAPIAGVSAPSFALSTGSELLQKRLDVDLALDDPALDGEVDQPLEVRDLRRREIAHHEVARQRHRLGDLGRGLHVLGEEVARLRILVAVLECLRPGAREALGDLRTLLQELVAHHAAGKDRARIGPA